MAAANTRTFRSASRNASSTVAKTVGNAAASVKDHFNGRLAKSLGSCRKEWPLSRATEDGWNMVELGDRRCRGFVLDVRIASQTAERDAENRLSKVEWQPVIRLSNDAATVKTRIACKQAVLASR